MNPHAVHWLVDHAPWGGLIVMGLTSAGWMIWLATDGRGLWKYGPRYWRVTRKQDRRRAER